MMQYQPCYYIFQGYVEIFFGDPKKHKVAGGAANITIFCEKVGNSGLQLRAHTKKLMFLFLNQNICCGYSKNCLNETVLLSTQNICSN